MSCDCGVTVCFYCREPLGEHEHDHFPIPVRFGGQQIVAACLRCHDLKDRVPFDKWPPDVAFDSLQSIFAKCTPIERLTLAKFFKIAMDAIAEAAELPRVE